jgi:hypothetical protein
MSSSGAEETEIHVDKEDRPDKIKIPEEFTAYDPVITEEVQKKKADIALQQEIKQHLLDTL